MAKLEIQVEEHEDGYQGKVIVKEGNKTTRHSVRVSREDFERLTGGEATPEKLLRASFEFLLERESKESILRSFDLMTINRYFPEYEREIRQRVR